MLTNFGLLRLGKDALLLKRHLPWVAAGHVLAECHFCSELVNRDCAAW